ncbi:hypothetical protein PPERSA_09438 [Pseudocohnilembus persalinus]|uniref:Uncharacterized protein n=1 Tax=Pseudocohnilembus persalinus TaxID=266149 RepID=A0A0V0Q9Q9_PSEPJ|nr:hypothetical protein PPERSA_09438 [Pseudocohnilembus persalinus]|eukprot:KRW98913.1 hypothetical protein PPERSA_09438 [Pseudocohnilembus persalinus]
MEPIKNTYNQQQMNQNVNSNFNEQPLQHQQQQAINTSGFYQQQQHYQQQQETQINNFVPQQNQRSRYNSQSPERELMGYSQMIPQNQSKLNQQPQQLQNAGQFNNQVENKSLDYAIHASLPNDIYELKSWVIDLRKEVENQKQQNQFLESKNKEQELFLSKQRDNYETFRNKVLNDNHQDKNEMLHLQDEIMNLQEKIYEVQKSEDNLQIENKSLKDKLEHEQLIKIRLEEQIRELEQKIQLTEEQIQQNFQKNVYINSVINFKALLFQRQKQKQIDRKEDDYMHMKQIDDQNKLRIQTLQDKIDQLEDQLRKANQFITKDQEDKEINLQKIKEIQGKSQQLQQDMEESELERFKGEVYQNKQQNLDKNQQEINLQMQIEKLSVEVQQLRALLNQSEMEMKILKDHNNHLLSQIQNMANQRGFDLSEQYMQLQKTLADKEKLAQDAMQAQQRLLEQQAYQQQIQLQQQQQQHYQRGRQGYQEFQLEESKSYTPQKQPVQQQAPYQYQQEQDQQQQEQDIDLDFQYKSRSPERTKMIKPKDQGIFYKEEETKVGVSPPGRRHANYNIQNRNQDYQQQESSNVYARPRQSNYEQDVKQKQIQEKFDYDQYMKQFQMNKSRSRKTLKQEYLNGHYNQSPQQKQQRQQSPIYQNDYPQQFQTTQQVIGNMQGVDQQDNAQKIENELMYINMEKEKLTAEIKKLEQAKRTGQTIKRRREAEQELEMVEKNISNLKIQLRKMNVLHRQ